MLHNEQVDPMTYTPKPIDTSNITLPKDISELTELLARNTHENWALLRLKEGWTYGPPRERAGAFMGEMGQFTHPHDAVSQLDPPVSGGAPPRLPPMPLKPKSRKQGSSIRFGRK
ncbi:MAG: RyR domain-containing protein [Desulfatiglandales bacterium]